MKDKTISLTIIGGTLALLCFVGLLASLGFAFPDSQKLLRGPGYMFELALSEGELPGMSEIRLYGYDNDLATTWEAIGGPSEPYEWPTSAQILDIVSTDADDTGVAGSASGAHSIIISGLDSDFNQQSETVTLTGATIAKTVNAYIRVNSVDIDGVGTYGGTNEGTITVSTTTDSDTVAVILANQGHALQAVYTVPAGYTAYLHGLVLSSPSNKTVDYRARTRQNADDTSVPVSSFRTLFRKAGISAAQDLDVGAFDVHPEKTDIVIEGQGAGNPEASASFSILLKAND